MFEWSIPFEFYQEHIDVNPSFLVCGTPLSRKENHSAKRLIENDDYSCLANPFSVLKVRDGEIFITTDPFSYQPIYWYRSDSLHICGTRADLVAKAAEDFEAIPMKLDKGCILNMLALGQAQGANTAFRNVKIVPAGHRVYSRNGRLSSSRFWDNYSRAKEYNFRKMDEVIDEFISAQSVALRNMVKQSNHPPEIDLTGGQDSRTVLALCLKAGITKDVRFSTMGSENAPDVILSSHLAKEFGLDFTIRNWMPPKRSWPEESRYRTLECFGRKRGQELIDPLPGKIWRSNGILGESLRVRYPGIPQHISRKNIIERHCNFFAGRKAFVRDDIVDKYVNRSKNKFAKFLDNGTPPNLAFDKFNLVQSQYTHFCMRPRHYDRNLLALYFADLTQLSFSLPYEKRASRWLLKEIYARCGLRTNIPFTKKLTKDEKLGLEIVPRFSKANTNRLKSEELFLGNLNDCPEWREESPNRYSFLKNSLLGNNDARIYKYVNYDAVEQILEKPFKMNLRAGRMLTDILSAHYWMEDFNKLAHLKVSQFSTTSPK